MTHNRDYFDSDEEFIFYCWLLEAKQYGVIKGFEIKPVTIEIFPSVSYTYEKVSISKVKKIKSTKIKTGTLLNPWNYTPDFIVDGDLSKFHTGTHKIAKPYDLLNYGHDAYIIDTKGTGARFKDSSKFPLIQKALYHAKGIYVNKIVPEYFFKNAWLPMPISISEDLLWTNLVALKKSGKIKPQKKRSAFKECKTYSEKYGKTGHKEGILKLF